MQKLIKKTTEMNCSTKVVQYQRHSSEISSVVQSKEINYTADIAASFTCTCGNFKTAAKKTCIRLVWLLIYVFKIKKTSSLLLAQIEISCKSFNELNYSLPDHLPEAVTQCTSKRRFLPKLKDHSNFNSKQIWYISLKKNGAASRCSGCMMPKQIEIGDFHLYAEPYPEFFWAYRYMYRDTVRQTDRQKL